MSNSESRTPSQALEALGLTLSAAAAPVAAYVPAARTDNPIFTSGQLPFVNGRPTHVGHASAEVTTEETKEATRICALNTLTTVGAEVGLDSVTRIMKIIGFVNSTTGFVGQPGVIDGASGLFGGVFGEHSQHARSTMNVNQLPLDIPVEAEIIVKIARWLLFLLP